MADENRRLATYTTCQWCYTGFHRPGDTLRLKPIQHAGLLPDFNYGLLLREMRSMMLDVKGMMNA